MHLACLIHMHLTSPQLRDQSLLSQQKWTVWIITKIKWSHTEPSYSWTDLTLCLTCGPLLPWTWDLMTQGHSVHLDAMLFLQSLPLCPSPPPTKNLVLLWAPCRAGEFLLLLHAALLLLSSQPVASPSLPVSMLCQLGRTHLLLIIPLWNFMLTSTPRGLQSSLLDPG